MVCFPAIATKRQIGQLCAIHSPVFVKRQYSTTPRRFCNQSSRFQLFPITTSLTNPYKDDDIPVLKVINGKFTRIPLCKTTRCEWIRPPKYLGPEYKYTTKSDHRPLTIKAETSAEHRASLVAKEIRLRAPTKTFLLLRPTVEKSLPVETTDDLFTIFRKSISLKILRFDRSEDAFKFYATHFPLMLTTITCEGERTPTPKNRRRPVSPMTFMINRKKELNEKVIQLDVQLDDLERETEDDCEFETELRHEIFDPTQWSFSTIDAIVMARRYTITEMIKEI